MNFGLGIFVGVVCCVLIAFWILFICANSIGGLIVVTILMILVAYLLGHDMGNGSLKD